jgi:hypothetical protein
MSVYTLDIDSSERDPTIYPDPNDYVIELQNPIYNVKKDFTCLCSYSCESM